MANSFVVLLSKCFVGTGPPRKRRNYVDPELSEEGRWQALDYRLVGRPSKKRVVDFCERIDTNSLSSTSALDPLPASSEPIAEPLVSSDPIVEYPRSPKGIRSKRRRFGKETSEEKEDKAAMALMSLPESQLRRPSKKRDVNFSATAADEDITNVRVGSSKKSTNKRKYVAPTPLEVEEALISFVENAEAAACYPEIVAKFNTPVPYKEIITYYREFLKEEMTEYEKLVEQRRSTSMGSDIVHVLDCAPNKKLSSTVYKRYNLTPENYRPFWCSQHSDNYKTVTFEVGFMIFLQCVYKGLPSSSSELIYESENEDEEEMEEKDHTNPAEKEIGDEETFCPSTEEKQAESVSLIALKQNISKTVQSAGEVDVMSHSLQLPILPEFQIEGNRYILLSDIQKVFSIREDYALAAIAKTAEQNDGFESDDSEDFLELEENFDPVECLALCFNKAKEQREKGQILSDKDFAAFQREIGYDKLEDSTKDFIERDTKEGSSSIDLFKKDTFLYDETEEVL